MCCNHFENWANCLSLIFCSFSCFVVAFYRLLDESRSLMCICTPQGDSTQQRFHQEQHSCWETNKGVPSLIAVSKVPNPARRQLGARAKNLSPTWFDPVDLEGSYYDHACLDPASVDADALSQGKSDYMGKKTSCSLFKHGVLPLPLSEKRKPWWFITSIYCQHQLMEHKKGQ